MPVRVCLVMPPLACEAALKPVTVARVPTACDGPRLLLSPRPPYADAMAFQLQSLSSQSQSPPLYTGT